MSDSPPDSTAGKRAKKSPSAKPQEPKKGRADGRIAATLLLSESVDFRLSTIAKSLKSDRSMLANKFIDQGLQRYGLDAALRQHLGDNSVGDPERAGE